MKDYKIVCAMADHHLFFHRIFKDGAFTSHDPKVRAFALQKVMKNMDLGAELGAKVYVFWGGREGTEVDASKTPGEAIKRYRECMNYLCSYARHQGYDFKFAIEPKPNEPRGDIFLATAGHVLAFIETLDYPEMVGVNPEIEHSRMAGLNTYHDFGQAMEAGKLYHADLGAQKPNRFDQDLRFGSEDLKETFFVVKLLEDHHWAGTRNFDEHPYRSEREGRLGFRGRKHADLPDPLGQGEAVQLGQEDPANSHQHDNEDAACRGGGVIAVLVERIGHEGGCTGHHPQRRRDHRDGEEEVALVPTTTARPRGRASETTWKRPARGLLEAARALRELAPQRRVVLVATSGEELGVWGATAYVDAHRDELAERWP